MDIQTLLFSCKSGMYCFTYFSLQCFNFCYTWRGCTSKGSLYIFFIVNPYKSQHCQWVMTSCPKPITFPHFRVLQPNSPFLTCKLFFVQYVTSLFLCLVGTGVLSISMKYVNVWNGEDFKCFLSLCIFIERLPTSWYL